MQKERVRYLVAGGLAGLTNGFFGGGGGSVLVPVLTRYCGLEQRQAFATSVAVILPLCLLSVAIYLFRGGLDIVTALPYLIGGTVGGWAGGRWFKGMKINWLRRGFGLLLICFPAESAQGVINGMKLALGKVIPALFPYFVLSGFVLGSGFGSFLFCKFF